MASKTKRSPIQSLLKLSRSSLLKKRKIRRLLLQNNVYKRTQLRGTLRIVEFTTGEIFGSIDPAMVAEYAASNFSALL